MRDEPSCIGRPSRPTSQLHREIGDPAAQQPYSDITRQPLRQASPMDARRVSVIQPGCSRTHHPGRWCIGPSLPHELAGEGMAADSTWAVAQPLAERSSSTIQWPSAAYGTPIPCPSSPIKRSSCSHAMLLQCSCNSAIIQWYLCCTLPLYRAYYIAKPIYYSAYTVALLNSYTSCLALVRCPSSAPPVFPQRPSNQPPRFGTDLSRLFPV